MGDVRTASFVAAAVPQLAVDVEGDDGGVDVLQPADGGGDALAGGVVQQPAPAVGVGPAGQQHAHLGLAVGGRLVGHLQCGPYHPAIGALDQLERQARHAQPDPAVLQSLGPGGVDGEVHGPDLVDAEGPGVLDGPGGGQVEPVDQDQGDVAGQRLGLRRPPRPPFAEHRGLFPVALVEADQEEAS